MNGCEIVCPEPIGSALSAYALRRNCSGTNSSRGTAASASSTLSSRIPRTAMSLRQLRAAVHAFVGVRA